MRLRAAVLVAAVVLLVTCLPEPILASKFPVVPSSYTFDANMSSGSIEQVKRAYDDDDGNYYYLYVTNLSGGTVYVWGYKTLYIDATTYIAALRGEIGTITNGLSSGGWSDLSSGWQSGTYFASSSFSGSKVGDGMLLKGTMFGPGRNHPNPAPDGYLYSVMWQITYFSGVPFAECTVSGTTGCVNEVELYTYINDDYHKIYEDVLTYSGDSYSYPIVEEQSYRILFDGAYYDFTCDGNEVFDYDACTYVYGYTCGIGDIHLYRDDSGWVLEDSVSQSMRLSDYEMMIEDGNDYKLNMHGISQLVDSYLFSCTGSHVHYDHDRCVYPPGPSPYHPVDPIIIWEGYDYNIVVFRDEHGNRVENAQVAVYDQTNSTYIQRWTPNPDGYLLLGALFNDSDHAVQVLMRTFDGVFTLETTYPANGSAIVGEEDVTQTNMTIPLHYNIRMHPVDTASMPIPGVFCGLSEYTPYDPLSFWGTSMGGRTTVPVGGCSGFAMCDIYAEKGGYTPYNMTALNWTSRSAMIKDYRHEVTMGAEP